MSEVLVEGQTRIDQYDALQWAWILLRRTTKQKARDRIREMLAKLSHGENVDFQDHISKLEETEEDSALATKNLLQRHRGTLTCRGCGQPILEGYPIVKRRVNSRARYYHQGCIYTEKKTEEDEEE